MRTTDVLITALFSPSAVAAIGLADIYAQFSLRFGIGLGGGAITLSSQDTGRRASADRDEAITQALVMGLLLSLPVVLFGLVFKRWAIAVLGADPETVALGSSYLTIVLLSAPMRILGLIGTRALQGTGDTRTPMVVNISSYVVNILGSLVLGLGFFVPQMGIVGVGLGTAMGNLVAGAGVLFAIYRPAAKTGFSFSRNLVITKQLIAVSTPRIAEGLATTTVYFPFNALLLSFGTEVNAGYQIGQRLYRQVSAPLLRASNTTASIIVGQSLGAGNSADVKHTGYAHAALTVVTLAVAGTVLFFGAESLVPVLTDDAATINYAVSFAQVFAVPILFTALFFSFSGALQGAGETRIPFVARVTGLVGFLLGFSYVVGVIFEYGAVGAYGGVVLMYVWWALVVTWSYVRGDWVNLAESMVHSRGNS